MAHPYNEHRDHHVQHRRVHPITHGLAHGGYAHSAPGSSNVSIRKAVSEVTHRAAGGRVKHRADRPRRTKGGRAHGEPEKFVKEQKMLKHPTLRPYEGAPDNDKSVHRARGGRTKGKKAHTTVNVMVSPHTGAPPLGGAALPIPPPGAVPPPIRPPMAGPPALPPGPSPGLAAPMARPPAVSPVATPGLLPRTRGGRVSRFARGGKVTDGPAYQEGKKARPVDHAPGKQDRMDIGRKKVITYKHGGRVQHAGLGTHHTIKPHHGKASGGLEPPSGATHGHGVEAPHHPKKGLGPITSDKGPMSPDFNKGAGGGGARLLKRKRAPSFVDKVP